jgi:ferredoxin
LTWSNGVAEYWSNGLLETEIFISPFLTTTPILQHSIPPRLQGERRAVMSEFIKVEIDFSRCVGIAKCGGCVKVCPVNIFGEDGGNPCLIEDNEDECTLCDLCIQACTPKAITIRKLYEANE